MTKSNKKPNQAKLMAAEITSAVQAKVLEAGEATKKMKKAIERSAEKLVKRLQKLAKKAAKKEEKKVHKQAKKAIKIAGKPDKTDAKKGNKEASVSALPSLKTVPMPVAMADGEVGESSSTIARPKPTTKPATTPAAQTRKPSATSKPAPTEAPAIPADEPIK